MTSPGQSSSGRAGIAAELRRSIDLLTLLVPVLAIVAALVVGAGAILIIGDNPIEAYWALLRGMYGSTDRVRRLAGSVDPVHRRVPRGGVRVPGPVKLLLDDEGVGRSPEHITEPCPKP